MRDCPPRSVEPTLWVYPTPEPTMTTQPSTPDRSSLGRRRRLFVVAVAAAAATLTAVAADGLGPDPADHRTAADEATYRRLVNEGQIPGAPRDGDVPDVTRRLVNEGLIPSAMR
jgi:hypothetical protein